MSHTQQVSCPSPSVLPQQKPHDQSEAAAHTPRLYLCWQHQRHQTVLDFLHCPQTLIRCAEQTTPRRNVCRPPEEAGPRRLFILSRNNEPNGTINAAVDPSSRRAPRRSSNQEKVIRQEKLRRSPDTHPEHCNIFWIESVSRTAEVNVMVMACELPAYFTNGF